MTLNQIENRIKALAKSHKQINAVSFGDASEYLNNKDSVYPVCFLQDAPGTIDTGGRMLNLNYKVFLLDQVNNSEDTKSNEREVISDMLEITQDLIALIDDPNYPEWKVASTPFSHIKDEYADIVAGVAFDISISVLRVKDKCAVPKDGPVIFENMFPKVMP